MEGALGSALSLVVVQASELGGRPTPEQLEQLRSDCAAALAVARGQGALGAAQQKLLWEAAAQLWNASIDLSAGGGSGGQRPAATLLQAACDLCLPLAPGALSPGDVVNLVRFHQRAGQAWAALGEYEAAEAVLARGAEAAQGLQALCFERRGRGLQHQECAEMMFTLLLERLQVAMRLDQQMLSSGLISQAQAFAADTRLPPNEGMAFRLRLVQVLHQLGEQLAKVQQPAAAVPLLSTAYETLSQLELDGGEGEDAELAAVAEEAQSMGASVLALLAYCNVEAGEAEQAMACLQALRQLGDPQAAAHFAAAFLSLRILLQLGRMGEAEAELLNLVSHEEATPEGCLAGLQAALAVPGGVPLARSALSLVMERFSEEPGLAVELVRAALRIATSGSSGSSTGRAEGSGAGLDAGCVAAAAGSQQAHQAGAAPEEASAAAEALVLELVADDRLLERVCDEGSTAGLRRELLGLLWNHAVAALHAGAAFDTALAFFSAALPLLDAGSSGMQIDECEGSQAEAAGGPQVVECRRAQALCCLGARQLDRALEFLAAADELEPGSVPTAMLRLSVQLEAGNAAGAAAAVAALADCAAAEPDVLRIACIQAVDAGARGAACQALGCLLDRCSRGSGSDGSAGKGDSSGSAPEEGGAAAAGSLHTKGYEATVFQNLIHLLLSDEEGSSCGPMAAATAAAVQSAAEAGAEPAPAQPAAVQHSAELARLFDQLVDRMRAVGGPEFFFLQQDGRPTQQEWFAATAWNAGQKVASAMRMEQAAVLLAVSGELYAALPTPTIPVLHKQKMAFLMAATAACEVHEMQVTAELADAAAAAGTGELGLEPRPKPASSGPASRSSMLLARSYLQQARGAAVSIQTQQALLGGDSGGGQQGAGADPQSDVYLQLLDFRLSWLAGDQAAQLDVLRQAQSLRAFGPQHFGTVADMARAGPPGGQGSLEVCRVAEAARLQRLAQETPLDCACAAAVLRSLMGMASADADKLRLLHEASGLLAAVPAGAFPSQEVRWLITTAWNRGAVHARFGRAAEAEPFQQWALEALRYQPQLAEQYQDEMQAALEKTRLMLDGGRVGIA